MSKCKITKRPAMPPLANTWAASRLPPLEYMLSADFLRLLKTRDNVLDERKKAINTSAQPHPPRPKVNAPNKKAARAPETVNNLKRYAPPAARKARITPKTN